MTWHDGVMRLARVTGSCHGLRDSHRDNTWLAVAKCSECHCSSIVPLSAISEFTQHGNIYKNHGLAHSFVPLWCVSYQVWCLGIDIRWLVLYGYGHVVMCPAIMRPVWVWPVSTARPEDPGWSLLRSGDHCQERDGAVISDVTAWHVMCDVRCSYWHPTSLTGRSRPALGILIAWLLRPSASRWIILESPHSSWCSNILFLWLINIQLQGNACAPAS